MQRDPEFFSDGVCAPRKLRVSDPLRLHQARESPVRRAQSSCHSDPRAVFNQFNRASTLLPYPDARTGVE
ncbi:hypothetical protein GCM10010390_33870 [Streptomyces mordarskii]|uniref:Uncharacterized protein n=1 Tax=Streptomyces mordarskii TaxID=1226758 RepID=A0ABN1CYS0_9ACTN